MRKLNSHDERKSNKTIRLSDEIWHRFVIQKPRNKSWDLYLKEIMDLIQAIKEL